MTQPYSTPEQLYQQVLDCQARNRTLQAALDELLKFPNKETQRLREEYDKKLRGQDEAYGKCLKAVEDQYKHELEFLRSSRAELERQVSRLNEEIKKAKSQPADVENLIKIHDKKENEAAAHYKRSLAEINEKLRAVERTAQSAQAELRETRENLKDAEDADKRAAALGEQLKAATVELNEAREKIKAFAAEPKAYREELKQAKAELAAARKQNAESDNFKDLFARSKRALSARDREVFALRNDLIRLQQELEIATRKLKAKENSFVPWESNDQRSFAYLDIAAV